MWPRLDSDQLVKVLLRENHRDITSSSTSCLLFVPRPSPKCNILRSRAWFWVRLVIVLVERELEDVGAEKSRPVGKKLERGELSLAGEEPGRGQPRAREPYIKQ